MVPVVSCFAQCLAAASETLLQEDSQPMVCLFKNVRPVRGSLCPLTVAIKSIFQKYLE